ncbi:hypothetical protein MMB75_25565 [Paenibacillus sp. P2(2022)]|uniref:hypothetical protein n=1 Tax=Paenibacillus TaxID=44249 RepID=UPI00096F4642|nr:MULTISPECIES: hypothetical protein [Paenibacillus]MDG0056998.1 hypothetical protein [Paenibacillus sp. P2(2022)]OMF50884.1 hypothetical protein BK135_01070 [Paenibacillus peoriae]
MATVQSTLQLYDNFSSKLNAVNQALQNTTRQMERLQTAARANIQINVNAANAVSELNAVQRRLQSLSDGNVRINIDAANAIRELEVVRNHIRQMGSGSVVNIVVNSADILREITVIRDRIRGMFTASVVNITINAADAIAQARHIRQQIDSQLRNIQARIQIQLPASLQAMFGNLQMLVLRLIRVVRQLRTSSGANAASLQAALARIEALEQKINQLQDQLNRRLREGGRNSEGMLSNLRNIAAAYVSIAAAKGLFENVMGGAMEQQQMISTFVARSGSEALGNAIYNAITKQALAAGQDVQQALSGTMSFMSSTLDPKQLAQLNKLSMRLAKLNPMEGLEGAAFSMKELLSGDYTSIVERFNIGRGTIKNSDALKAGKAGDIEGFIKGMDKLLVQQNLSEKAFSKMLDSPAAKWQKLVNTFKFNLAQAGNAAVNAFAPLFDVINKAFASGKFDQFFGSIQAGMSMIAQVTSSVVQFLINNWDLVKNTLLVLGVVAAAVAVGFAVDWIIAVWPLALIVAGIIAIITILNKFGISTGQVVAFVVGIFYAMFAQLNNWIAGFWNVILDFVEFFANIFIDPVYAIKKLFYDLWNDIGKYFVDLINKMVDGLNWLIEKTNSITGSTISAIQYMKMEDGPQKPTTDKDVLDFSKYRMQSMDVLKAFNSGKTAANDLTKSISNFSLKGTAQPYTVPKMPKQNGNIGNVGKVGKVGKIEDKVDISSEDLKVMRDIAEMKSIQNFVTLTPTVQVKTGDINNGADVDTIIKKIGDHLEEQFVSTAQGVYT